MAKKTHDEGLSLGYRIGYRVRYLLLSLFGPAQLGGEADPQRRLREERAARVEAARRERLGRESGTR